MKYERILMAVILFAAAFSFSCAQDYGFKAAAKNPELREEYVLNAIERLGRPEHLVKIIYVDTKEEIESFEKFSGPEKIIPSKPIMTTEFTVTSGERRAVLFVSEEAFSFEKEADFVSALRHEYTHIRLENDPNFITFVEGKIISQTSERSYWKLREAITELKAYDSQFAAEDYQDLSEETKSILLNRYMFYYTYLWSLEGETNPELLDYLKIDFFREWMNAFKEYRSSIGYYLKQPQSGKIYILPKGISEKPLGMAPILNLGAFLFILI